MIESRKRFYFVQPSSLSTKSNVPLHYVVGNMASSGWFCLKKLARLRLSSNQSIRPEYIVLLTTLNLGSLQIRPGRNVPGAGLLDSTDAIERDKSSRNIISKTFNDFFYYDFTRINNHGSWFYKN